MFILMRNLANSWSSTQNRFVLLCQPELQLIVLTVISYSPIMGEHLITTYGKRIN